VVQDSTGDVTGVFSTAKGVFSSSFLVTNTCDAGGTILISYSALDGSEGTRTGQCGGTTFNAPQDIVLGSSGKVVMTFNSATNNFAIWNIGGSRTCQGTIATYTAPYGSIIHANNVYYVASPTAGKADIVSAGCADTGDISATNTGLTTAITDINVNTVRNEMYIASTSSIAVMQADAPTTRLYLLTRATVDTGASTARLLAVSTDHNSIGITQEASTNFRIFQLGDEEIEEGGEPTPTEEFCNDLANAEILICRLQEIEGGALGSASQSFGNSTNDIFVQIGLVEEGSDIQTNGVGYMLVALGLALMIVMFYLGSGGELGKIPTFVWVLGALMVVGGLTGFGFVDSTFFIIAILVIIALASTKILSALERF
jgi:hypothetical protein